MKKAKKEKSEYEKISEYYTKISQFHQNHYMDFLGKNQFCDFYYNNEWLVGFIQDKNDYYLTILDYNNHFLYDQDIKYQMDYNENVAYFRKYTKPLSYNIIKERLNKNKLNDKIKILQKTENINIFNEEYDADEKEAYRIYCFLHVTLYNSLDLAIAKSKDKSSGVEEGFKIILIILEYLSEFYKYINNNFDVFINYKNELSNSELADLVLIEKKYAIFSFWDDANLLMNKIFLNNENYLEWFSDSEKILQKIMPSSPNFKKITSEKKIFCALYQNQIAALKGGEYNYKSLMNNQNQNLLLKKICKQINYDVIQNINDNSKIKIPTYILSYFIDYFNALGGYDTLFKIANQISNSNSNLSMIVSILENLCYAIDLTDNFGNKYEVEKNAINKNIIKFMDEINEKNWNKFNKNLVIKFFRKGCDLYPRIQKNDNNNFIFEELYIRYILKTFLLTKNDNKKMEIMGDVINILYSIEYNNLFKEEKKEINEINNNKNNINDKNIDEIINNEKYKKRDKLIKEMNYTSFCSNLKNNKIIEHIFNHKNLNENAIELFLPILNIMYKNFFGFEHPEKFNKEIKELKKLIFNKILKIIRENITDNNTIQRKKILCGFCEVLKDDDKYFFFCELKTIYYDVIYNQIFLIENIFELIVEFTCISVKKSENNNSNNTQENNNNIFDEKKFYGTELIYGFILEEFYEQYNALEEKQKNDLINNSINSIIKILGCCDNKDIKLGINILLNKINSSLKNKKDVITHLLLLQTLVNSDINIDIIDEGLKKMNLFLTLINELKEFLNKAKKENNNKMDKIMNDNNQIKKRIQTIFALIPNYTRNNFDFSKVKEFIILITQYNEFSRNIFYECLLNTINNFSKDFLMYINTEIITKKEIFDIKNFMAYKIYKKIIIKMNMINNTHFIMNNQDLLIMLNDNSDINTEIKGFENLWNLLLNDEQNISNNIINDCINFICDILFGIRLKTSKNLNLAYKSLYEDFINNISQKLNSFIISKKNTKNIKAIKSLILLFKQIVYRAKNINGQVIKNIKDIKAISPIQDINQSKSSIHPTEEYTFLGLKPLSDTYYLCDIKLKKDENFYSLRYTLSSIYKIPVNQIMIFVYMNNLGKSELNQKNIEKIMKESPLKAFNMINDFDNIYQLLKGLYDFNVSKKKSSLLIRVKCIKNIWEEIFKINLIDIILNNSSLPLNLINLLRDKKEDYTFDIIDLLKENEGYNNIIIKEIEKAIKSSNINNSILSFDNASIFYINYIINNLNKVSSNYKEFIRNNFINNFIMKLKILNDEFNMGENNNININLSELYEKYKLYNNLVKLFIAIVDYNKKDENNINYGMIYKILNIYYHIINDSIYINFKNSSTGLNEKINIENIKDKYKEILDNINDAFINNKKIFIMIINSLINNDINNNNIYMNKIKNIFGKIIFESVIKNKFRFINTKIKYLVIGILNKYKSTLDKDNINLNFIYYFYELFISENFFNKIISLLQEINEKNININNQRYEYNTKILFNISSQVLFLIYEYIKTKINFHDYINKTLSPKIFNYNNFFEKYFPNYSIFPQFILGGIFKLYCTLLLIDDINNININDNKFLEFLFNNIIMPNTQENILTTQNIFSEKNNNNINNISSGFCIKEASNLFILILFKYKNNYEEYLNKLNKFHKLDHWKGYLLSDWKLYYKNTEKMTNFIGLKNLGSTCYINTIIQVFYNIPILREALLLCETPFSGGKNSLYQLKKVFYALKFIQTNYYTPTSFIENFDNKKLDPKIQMDVFEFLCDLLEKIEQKLKKSQNENIIKYFFMGIQNDILTFDKPCEHHRINESKFYSIQLQVQNKFNLYESLDTFIEGERMDKDNCIFCEQCNKKFPAVKSQNFKFLPKILIFVLKRFEFNYNTMQKYKINDYYEFPLNLDMNKYMQKNNNNSNDKDNMYKLKSIIIHSGTCESGHYYAYILDDKNGEWYEFNDTKVTKFDIKNLDVDAFGKNEVIYEYGQKIEKENTKSAYMLFYEKVNQNYDNNYSNIKAINDLIKNGIITNKKDNDNDDAFNLLNDDVNTNSSEINYDNIINYTSKALKFSNEEINDILKPMNKEMYEYFLNKRLFSGEYHHFILSLFINILNLYKISKGNKLSFSYNSCYNDNNYIFNNEIKNFKSERKNPSIANINYYLSKQKILLINKSENKNNNGDININNEEKEKILEMFKCLLIYFFNVMIRAREKDYLGGTVDLIKYYINNYLFCADYFIEEFSNQNVLIEYMINCPSYDIKKLIVGIIYCAMINCIKTYERNMRQIEEKNKNEKNKNKNMKNKKKEKIEQPMNDEEFARKLQEEENNKYLKQNPNYINDENNKSNNTEESSNPLERKYIPKNIVKLIYNILHVINIIKFQNLNESRFLYLILFRFSTISNKCKKFLLNKALVLEFLNILFFESLKQETHNDSKIIHSMDKGCFTPTHSILYEKKEINAKYDIGGAFHYENYISELYFYLLSHNQKAKPKRPYFEGSFNFDNKSFVKAIFFKVNTKLDANVFGYLIGQKCLESKSYKNRIDWILENIGNILDKADYNEKINYDINSNRDVFNHNNYNSRNSNEIDYENEIPKINPKYTLLILKKFILHLSESKKIDEYRINQSLTKFFEILEKNQKYYNFSILLIDFITELFSNNITLLYPYIPTFSPNIKNIINWLQMNSISPELYPIEGLYMYKSDNINYRNNVTEEEIKSFNDKNIKSTEKRIDMLIKIMEYKKNSILDNDYVYESYYDFSDFKFRKGDYIFYNKKKAVIKENLDELILIKIVDKKENIIGNKNNYDDMEYTKDEMEKIKFWVAKDDKNISVYNLE